MAIHLSTMTAQKWKAFGKGHNLMCSAHGGYVRECVGHGS